MSNFINNIAKTLLPKRKMIDFKAGDSITVYYKIKEGKVIIFPSWLTHYVDPNPVDSLRVSVPFNAKYTQHEN